MLAEENAQMSSLGWSGLLATTTLLVASALGVLALESSAPCRLSRRKLRFLFALQAVQSTAALAAAVLAVRRANVSGAPIAPVLLLLCAAAVQIGLDALLAARRAADARVHWLPLSVAPDEVDTAAIAALAPTTALLAALLGLWPTTIARSIELMIGGIMCAFATAALSVLGLLLYICIEMWLLLKNPHFALATSLLPLLRDLLGFSDAGATIVRPTDATHRHVYRHLYDAQRRSNDSITLRADDVNERLQHAPLHLRGAIVAPDDDQVYVVRRSTCHKAQTASRIIARLSLLPILVWAVAAAARSNSTFSALSPEMTELVAVITLVDLAFGIKFTLWSVEGYANDEADEEM